jgi:hypothetical protein
VADSRRLQQLVDERRYDELLREVTLDDIARAWIRYQRRNPTGDEQGLDDPDWWAVELWMDNERRRGAWWTDEARVRGGILAIVAAAGAHDVGIIGAGIMELFIANDDDRISWLEEQARDSDMFRRSLANVYVWGSARKHIAERVERAAGVPLPRSRFRLWRRA